ncbi:class II D-tagatose-bisphosphate aldolase non-catalytic subunit [Patescibacteria group bacterium]
MNISKTEESIPKLGVGPMSQEITEAIFKYSHFHRNELMIIASKNQIDYDGGYVNGWTTKEFMDFVKDQRATYPNSDVKICRDHCGPGFNGNYDLEDSYKTVEDDIKNGFDLIHIDFCHFKGTKDERFEESKKIIEHCLKLNPNILLEVGTDENTGTNYNIQNLKEIEEEVNFFKGFCNPEFYVVQTGSLVKEINQAGSFNKQFTESISKILKEKGLKLKEHNADYLSREGIVLRNGIVDAINIAPQLGVVQTQFILNKCLVYGVNFEDFLQEVYSGKKWGKWLSSNSPQNKTLCSIIAGHYHFSSESYKKIIKQLEEYEDIHESIIDTIMDVINHYVQK